jgi:Anti-sigma-K factor rskA
MTDQRRPADLTHDEALDLAASFVLGALDVDEMAAVRAHLTTCQQSHTDFEELAGVVPVFHAAVQPIEPPPGLKDRIMAAAAADLEARRREAQPATAVPAPAAPAAPPAVRPTGPVPVPRQPRWSWALAIAAVLAIVALGGWNLSLQSQLSEQQAYQQQVATVLDAAAQPGALAAIMKGPTAEAPSGLAVVTPDGAMRIAMRDLAPTTGQEVYEAWAILPDAAPVPLGGFRVGSNGVGYLEADGLPTQSGVVLALTREPGPGATAPTTDPVSVGTAAATS